MLNAVGREIPDEILEITGKEPFQGNNYKEGVEYRKQGPMTKSVINSNGSKLVDNIRDVDGHFVTIEEYQHRVRK